jgi:succinylglutamate desuccinylase
MLTVLDTLPERFLDTPAANCTACCCGPTLIHLPGRRTPPLFVSVLLHGNEDTGVVALQSVLRAYGQRPLPRALSILVGNVAAARDGLRRLDINPTTTASGQGAEHMPASPEHAAMSEVHRSGCRRAACSPASIFTTTPASIRTTAWSTDSNQAVLHLALLFSRTVVWFRGLPGTQTTAFSPLCPSLTIECGKPGKAANEAHVARFIEACLHLAQFPFARRARAGHRSLSHRRDGAGAGCGVVRLRRRAGRYRLRSAARSHELPAARPGTVFGRTRLPLPLDVQDESGRDVAAEFFACGDGTIRLRRASMPAMLTLDERVVRQDCLCYLMERLPFPRHERVALDLCASV